MLRWQTRLTIGFLFAVGIFTLAACAQSGNVAGLVRAAKQESPVGTASAQPMPPPAASPRPMDRPDLPPAKATLAAKQDQEILNARETPHPKPPKQVVDATSTAVAIRLTQSPLPTPTFTTGLFKGGSDAFVNRDFGSKNYWIGEVGGVWYQVYAGVRQTPSYEMTGGPDPNRHGALDVIACADPCQAGHRESHRYDAPTGTDAVKITVVQGTKVDLVSDSGKKLSFDLLTHTFSPVR